MVLASQGAQAQLAMDPSTFDTSSEPYEFVREGLKLTEEHIDSDGIRGTRSHNSERTRGGLQRVGGTILLNPSPLDLDLLLPRILGAAESVNVFALAETLPSFNVMVDRVAKVFTYSTCYINRATFRSRSGSTPWELELDIIGTSESVGNAGTFPALTLGVTAAHQFYTHSDVVVNLASSARVTESLEIVIDNQLDAAFRNSRTATSITPRNRIVTVRTQHPYTSAETDLYAQAVAGAAGSIVFTNGSYSTTFTFGCLQVPSESPGVDAKAEIPLTLNMTARMLSTTRELVVTNVSA